MAAQNGLLRLSGRAVRNLTHPPAAVRAVLADAGLRPVVDHRGAVPGRQRNPLTPEPEWTDPQDDRGRVSLGEPVRTRLLTAL